MKLVCCEHANVGDALNRVIFEKLLGSGFFDDDEELLFFGIGTILGLKTPPAATRKAIVFSSGYAPDYAQPPDMSRHEVVCVRGPLTANFLGLDESAAVADGAYLLNRALEPEISAMRKGKDVACTYVPHESQLPMMATIRGSCERAGVRLLSPHTGVLDFIQAILASELVLAEAMHAAIIADTLRVPWIPVSSGRGISAFKWADFCASMGLLYSPRHSPHLFSRAELDFLVGLRTGKRTALQRMASACVTGMLARTQSVAYGARLARALRKAKGAPPLLSRDEVVAVKQARLLERLDSVHTIRE
jgi:succinoglycan biosynthesis protein ExoV